MPGIQVPPDSTGKIVETILLTDHRQVFIVGGDAAVAERAAVRNVGPVGTNYGLVTRDIPRREGQVLTTVALGISGVFTQAGQDGTDDGVVYVAAVARADVASAASGFIIEEYDGADDDFVDAQFIRTVASKSVVAATTTYLYGAIRGRKWRVKYTNGATAQLTFKLTASASVFPLFTVDAEGQMVAGLLDSAGTRISPALTGQLPAALVGGRLDVNVGASAAIDVTDRAARAVGAVSPAAASVWDVSDRAARNLGALAAQAADNSANSTSKLPTLSGVANAAAPARTEGNQVPLRTNLAGDVASPAAASVWDVSDRAARLVGQVEGRAASGVAVAGNPNLLGGRANLNEPVAVADAQAVSLWADLFGRLVHVAGHPNPEPPVTVNKTAAASSVVIAAPAAGTRLVIRKGSVHNTGVENVLTLLDGATARWVADLAADGGGSLFNFGDGGWKLAAATALNATLSVAGDVNINVTEYSIETV